MHQESSNATLKYGREELLNLRRDFNIKQSQRVILEQSGILYNAATEKKKLRRGTKGKRKHKIQTIISTRNDATSNYASHNNITPANLQPVQREVTKCRANNNNLKLELPSIFYTNARSLNTTKKMT